MKQVAYAIGGVVVALGAWAPSASAQQVMWKDNPISGKVVGLTYGTSSWTAAEAQAVAYGGHLLTIRNASENDWLRQQSGLAALWAPSGLGPWIGLNDIAQEGAHVWVSGEAGGGAIPILGEQVNLITAAV